MADDDKVVVNDQSANGTIKEPAAEGSIAAPAPTSDAVAPANDVTAPAGDTAAPAGTDQQGRQLYNVKCAECGKDTQVPFKPSGDRPVYCKDCYMQKRG